MLAIGHSSETIKHINASKKNFVGPCLSRACDEIALGYISNMSLVYFIGHLYGGIWQGFGVQTGQYKNMLQ